VTGKPNQCGSGYIGTVHVFGGQPPYQLYNSMPTAIQLSTGKVNDAGGRFDITFLGTRFSGMPMTVKDDMGRIATLVLTNLPGSSGT
jgi:hypothetical protein